MSLAGSTAAIAAPFRDAVTLGGDHGAVYIFDMDGLAGDGDTDCDVDLSDFEGFDLCSAGPDQPPADTCPAGVDADLDGDGDVDRADFALFQVGFTGE